uniref:Integrase catalytic domain-containing protein n=1 Tax=Wuchereria bancrofti TaxID=6293 RepID=A0AAF5PJS4_WUCBA
MAEDLSAENFLHVLRRFVVRRGYPKLVLSDNASQFQLVFKTIIETNANFLAEKGMVWKNTIPRSPWGGGVYERMIGLTKGALRKAIGRKLLKEGELITLTAEVEGILNTRPLTYVSSEDYRVVRPIDFIAPTSTLDIPINYDNEEEEYTPNPPKTKDKLLKYWANTLKTLDVFWKLWREEYLTSLRERTQKELICPRFVEKRIPRENEIVLLSEPETPRGICKLARIIKINKGWDGRIRSATIQMSNGKQLDRSINKLCPMSAKERSLQTKNAVEDKSNSFMKTLLLMTTISLMSVQTVAKTNCKWTSGIPFNVPEKWNCEKIYGENVTWHNMDVHTRTHIRIPAIKCSNITRTVCTKAFLRLALSVVSDKTTTSVVTPQFCRTLYSQTKVTATKLIQSFPNKWITNNEIQYSYGWLGVKCQSTINFVMTKGEILFYEGRRLAISENFDLYVSLLK